MIILKRSRTSRRPIMRSVGYNVHMSTENMMMQTLNQGARENQSSADQDESSSNSTNSTEHELIDVNIE